MALQSIKPFNRGGGADARVLFQALRELQGLRAAVVTGGAAATDLPCADIKAADTVLLAVDLSADADPLAVTQVKATIGDVNTPWSQTTYAGVLQAFAAGRQGNNISVSLVGDSAAGTGVNFGATPATKNVVIHYESGVTTHALLEAAINTLNTAPTVTSYTPSAAGGTLASATYFYKITALVGGVESVPSAESAGQVVTGPTGSVAIVWPAVTGATGYRIYRGTGAGLENGYYQVGAVTTFTDTGAAFTAAATPPTQAGCLLSVKTASPTPANILTAPKDNTGIGTTAYLGGGFDLELPVPSANWGNVQFPTFVSTGKKVLVVWASKARSGLIDP